MSRRSRPTAAVIGAGVSGLTAAHVLKRTHDVTLFETDARLGGHAHTHDVRRPDGAALRIDSGFIVHNDRDLPEPAAPVPRARGDDPTDRDEHEHHLRWLRPVVRRRARPPRDPRPALARRRPALRAHAHGGPPLPPAGACAARTIGGRGPSVRPIPRGASSSRAGGFSDYFVRHFAIPLVACVWSAGGSDAGAYPARHLFRFLDHHGMLSVSGSPTWRTVTGGSATYVDRLVARLADVRTSSPVTSVIRHDDGVDVRTAAGVETFDRAVVATHADQALDLLADASPHEKADLSAIRYSANRHLAASGLFRAARCRAARASWNYRMASCDDASDKVLVSYWMNRLQGISDSQDHVVTLNAAGHVDPSTVTARMVYEHPIFTRDAVAAASRLRTAGGDRLAFAGAHLGWGFHEDGCRSGVEAAERLGATW